MIHPRLLLDEPSRPVTVERAQDDRAGRSRAPKLCAHFRLPNCNC